MREKILIEHACPYISPTNHFDAKQSPNYFCVVKSSKLNHKEINPQNKFKKKLRRALKYLLEAKETLAKSPKGA